MRITHPCLRPCACWAAVRLKVLLLRARAARRSGLTICLWVGFVPFFLIGAGLSWLRTNYYTIRIAGRFRCAPGVAPTHARTRESAWGAVHATGAAA